MELVKLLAVLTRRKWMLVQAVVFFTVASAVLALSLPRQYRATARLIVSTSEADASVLSDLGLQELAVGLVGASEDIQNHIAMLTANPILERVVWKLQLRNSEGQLLPAEKLMIPGIDAAFIAPSTVSVAQHQGTDIILVTATSNHPDRSRMLADALAHTYIEETETRARRETQEARAFVESRLEVVRAEFERAMSEIADVQQREQVVDLEAEVRSAVTRVSDLMLSGEENAARVQELRAQIAEVERFQAQESASFMAPNTVAQNVDIRGYREELSRLRIQRETQLLEKTERHPDLVRLEAQILSVESALTKTLQEQHALQPNLVKLKTELSGLLKKGAELNAAIERTTERFAQYPDKMRTLSQLQLASSAAEQVYRSLQDQSYQIAIAEAMSVSPLQFVEPARLPERQLFPKLLPFLVYGLLLGSLFGLGLVVVLEYVDDSIHGAEDLRENRALSLLGLVPQFEPLGSDVAGVSPTHALSEAFRTLRSALEYATVETPARLFGVTSSLPGEGKSTVVAHLAMSFAREGRRVLVVDGDLRRPSQHGLWGVDRGRGLTSVLGGEMGLAEAVQSTSVGGLQVLTAGAISEDPGRLVESLKLRQLLLEAAKGWDVVLVDTPPVLLVNDAGVIGRVVDHLLLVVEAHGTSRGALKDATDRLELAGIKNVGAVLNRVRESVGGRDNYHRAAREYFRRADRAVDEGVA